MKKNQERDGGVYGLQKCSKIHHLSPGPEESQPHPDMLLNQLHKVLYKWWLRMFVYVNVTFFTFYLYQILYLTSGNISYAVFLHQKI